MLKDILNDPILNSKAFFSIILLPPNAFRSNGFNLESHVIHIPWGSCLKATNARLRYQRAQNHLLIAEILAAEKSHANEQWLISVDNTVYRTSMGTIYHDHRKAKIVHSELLYALPEKTTCTHLVLYLDQSIVDSVSDKPLKTQYSSDLCFRDMIRRILPSNNSDDIIRKVDALISKFCDTSVYCESLESLHDSMEDSLFQGYSLIDNLDSSAIPNFTTDINIDSLYTAFESYIMESTYDVVFFKITQLLLPQDRKLTAALEDMEHLDFLQIALPPSITDERKRVQSAISEFERIGSFRTPAEKLDCLLSTVSRLTKDSTQADATFLDSDSLIPLLLMTLIRSKVPHLTANLVYIKDYTFERNITSGKYGYALSTFEGVLDYILEAHPDLSKLSAMNVSLWSSIKAGDTDGVKRWIKENKDDDGSADIRDREGNNPLMIACIHGQAEIAAALIRHPDYSTNDDRKTPLMCAMECKSTETVQLLLSDEGVQATINAVDVYGYTAALYASSTNDLNLLKFLPKDLLSHVNDKTGDTALHIASRYGCSQEIILYILDTIEPRLIKKKNGKGETFVHLCSDRDIVNSLVRRLSCFIDITINSMDLCGRSPVMTWAALGRLDLMETMFPYLTPVMFARIDKDGRTALHLITMHLSKGLTLGNKSLDYIVEKMKPIVNVRDWCYGNTALHFAAETSTLASQQSTGHAVLLIKALIRYGAALHAVNFKDEQPVNLCRIPKLVAVLDEMYLFMDPALSPVMKHSMYQYSWAVTRSSYRAPDLFFMIKSGQVGKPESMRLVSRRLQDFTFLRKELLYEMPELFLPTFQQLSNPVAIDLCPPPLTLIDSTLTQLQSFMEWLQYHPVLRYHDLVMSFVRSSSDLQKSVIRDNSFSRRKLLLEKISDLPINGMMSSKEEEHFLTYAQDMMMPLKSHFYTLLNAIRKLKQVGYELEGDMLMVAQECLTASSCLEASDMFSCNSLAIETIRICANMVDQRAFVSPLLPLQKTSQAAYAMVDGILLSLQRPFTLIQERCGLRESIESQKEVLRKSKGWQGLFSPKEKKKRADESKEKVIQNMNELNHLDCQINEAHRVISDELAHFQDIHPKKIVKTLRTYAKHSLVMERQRLLVLQQTLDKWEKPLPYISNNNDH